MLKWAPLPGGSAVKNLSARAGDQVRSLGWEDLLEEGMDIHSSILAWRIPHGQRSLAGYSPWGCKDLDMTERLNTFTFKVNVELKNFEVY